LAAALAVVEAAQRKACAHPLSSRKALLVAVLLDNLCDEIFEAVRHADPALLLGTEDVLAYRERLRSEAPALGLVFDLCALQPGSPRLETRAIPVPVEAYSELQVEDFMVSLYNGNAVPRVVIASETGAAWPAHGVFEEAVAFLTQALRAQTG
jgi:hypothetical protein